jgi:hypothetical protein
MTKIIMLGRVDEGFSGLAKESKKPNDAQRVKIVFAR